MKCPFCNFLDTQVKDSRPSEEYFIIKRRRFCNSCGGKFTTLERIENREIKVIKRCGDIRPFDSTKLLKSLEIATRKRYITVEQLDNIVTKIIKNLEKFSEGEVTSIAIGQLAMNELAQIDQVAYVRYASVYKDFNEISDFINFIKNINYKNAEEA